MRPVGGEQQQIVVAPIAQPDRKTQVVADRQIDPPTPAIDHHPRRALVVVPMFAGHAEPMAFIVGDDGALGRRPDHAVEALAALLDDQAPAQHAVERPGTASHPIDAGAVHGLRHGRCVHGEPRREHLRQQRHIGVLRQVLKQGVKARPIARRVMPMGGRLHEAKGQAGRHDSQLKQDFGAVAQGAVILAEAEAQHFMVGTVGVED